MEFHPGHAGLSKLPSHDITLPVTWVCKNKAYSALRWRAVLVRVLPELSGFRLTMGPHSNGTFPATAVGPRGLIDRFDRGADRPLQPRLAAAAEPPFTGPSAKALPCPSFPLLPATFADQSTCGCWSRPCGHWGMRAWRGSSRRRAVSLSSRPRRRRSVRQCCVAITISHCRWECNAMSWYSVMCSRSLDGQH